MSCGGRAEPSAIRTHSVVSRSRGPVPAEFRRLDTLARREREILENHAGRLIDVRRNLVRILDERALRRMAGEADRTADPGSAGARGYGG